MDVLPGKVLLNKKLESTPANTAIQNMDYVLYYFSASWCPAEDTFLPKLKSLFAEAIKIKLNLQIIFVPANDISERARLLEHFTENHGDWYAIPPGDGLIIELQQQYSVTAIPKLIVVKNNGDIITWNGERDVENLGPSAALGTWLYQTD